MFKFSKPYLTEGVSSVVYHWTSLYNCCEILKTNSFHMSRSIGTNEYGNKKFYMSTTRNRNLKVSYANTMFRHAHAVARLQLDGDKLNATLKGFPVDYYGEDGKQRYYTGINIPFALKQFHWDNEMEDRVVSNKPTIENFSQYIIRVDIYCADTEYCSTQEMEIIRQLKQQYPQLVHVYDNKTAFNHQTDKESNMFG